MRVAIRRLRNVVPWTAATLALVFLIAPFVVVLGASLDTGEAYHASFPPRGFVLTWYRDLPLSYLRAAGISFGVAVAVACVAGVVGTTAALGLVRGNVAGREALHAVLRLPLQIPLVVTGAVFLQFFYVASAATGWNPLASLAGLVIAHVFVALPYVVGSASSILVRLNPRLEEAARSLGASEWATFWQVTFPAIRPGVAAGMFYAFIVSFGDVPIAIFLAQSDRATLPLLIFQDMQFDFRPTMLAASTLTVIVSAILVFAVQRVVGLDIVLSSKRNEPSCCDVS